MHLLIVTNRSDSHVDHLIRTVASTDIDVFRLNTEDILTDYKIHLEIGENELSGTIHDLTGRVFHLDRSAVGWYRKPDLNVRSSGYDPQFANLVRSEVTALMEALYSSPNIKWINKPQLASAAKSKIQQLVFAQKHGLAVPDTIITNSESSAVDFWHRHSHSVITKSIYTANVTINGLNAAIPTTSIDEGEFTLRSNLVALCPTQLQSKIDKLYELRITVVGNEVFAAKIDSQAHESTRVDWRLNAEICDHSEYLLPDFVREFSLALLLNFGLDYGCIDIIREIDGAYVFLENNPYGQYLWIELKTGMKITDALVRLFRLKDAEARSADRQKVGTQDLLNLSH